MKLKLLVVSCPGIHDQASTLISQLLEVSSAKGSHSPFLENCSPLHSEIPGRRKIIFPFRAGGHPWANNCLNCCGKHKILASLPRGGTILWYHLHSKWNQVKANMQLNVSLLSFPYPNRPPSLLYRFLLRAFPQNNPHLRFVSREPDLMQPG